jgi:hypothetical protein
MLKHLTFRILATLIAISASPSPSHPLQGRLIRPAGMSIQETRENLFSTECFESLIGKSIVFFRFPHPDGGSREVWFEDPSAVLGHQYYISDFFSN